MDSNFRFWYVFLDEIQKEEILRRAVPHFPLPTAGEFCQSNFSGNYFLIHNTKSSVFLTQATQLKFEKRMHVRYFIF